MEPVSLKEQVVHAVKKKADSEKMVAEVCKESEQRMVRLYAPPACRNRAEKLTRLLVTDFVCRLLFRS